MSDEMNTVRKYY